MDKEGGEEGGQPNQVEGRFRPCPTGESLFRPTADRVGYRIRVCPGRSVEFSTLVVIASAIGLESAVTGSGLSDIIAGFLERIGGGDPRMALAAVFLGCIALDTLITNVASAVFMFPVALAMATSMGVSFMPFAVTVMVGASCSFISPMGYQTNLMVYGPGGYSFVDYVKIGVPLTVVVGVVTLFLTPIIYPF